MLLSKKMHKLTCRLEIVVALIMYMAQEEWIIVDLYDEAITNKKMIEDLVKLDPNDFHVQSKNLIHILFLYYYIYET